MTLLGLIITALAFFIVGIFGLWRGVWEYEQLKQTLEDKPNKLPKEEKHQRYIYILWMIGLGLIFIIGSIAVVIGYLI